MKKLLAVILCSVITVFGVIPSVSAYTYYYYYTYIVKPSYVSVYNQTDTSLSVNWGTSSNAEGYVLYCKKQGGSFKKIKTLKGRYNTSYVHKKLTNGKKYTYKVKAYGTISGKKKYSDYSPQSTKKVIEPLTTSSPKLYSVSAVDTDTFKISWDKLSRASGYILYYSTNGKSYKTLATLSKGKTTYTHTGLTADVKYFYKVRAFRNASSGKKYSKYSRQVGLRCTNYLVDLYEPYTKDDDTTVIKSGKTFKIAGDNYSNGLILGNSDSSFYGDDYAFFNLKGKYKYLTMTIGVLDGGNYDSKFSIYSDDALVGTFDVYKNSLPKTVTIDIENADKLEFRKYYREGRYIGIANIRLQK